MPIQDAAKREEMGNIRDELNQEIIKLKKTYQNKNPDRQLIVSLLDHLNQLNPSIDSNVILGIVLLGIKAIDKEPQHKLLSAGGTWFSKGSDVYKALKKMAANVTDADQQLVCFEAAYTYLKNHSSIMDQLIGAINLPFHALLKEIKQEDRPSMWDTPNMLRQDLEGSIDTILKKEKKNISRMLSGPPSRTFMKDTLTEIIKQYRDLYVTADGKATKRKHNSKRDLAVDIIEFANNTCDKFFGLSDANSNEKFINSLRQVYEIRLAAILYVMKEIEYEYGNYEYVFWPPEMSKLYQFCQKASGLVRSTDMNAFHSNKCLKGLFSYIDNLPQIMEEIKQAANESADKYELDQQAVQRILENWKDINENLHYYTRPVLDVPPNISGTVGAYAKYGVEYAFNTGVSQLTSFIFVPSAGKKLLKAAGGAIGYAVFGPGGALLGTFMASLVTDTVVSPYIGTPFVTMLQPIGSAIGSVAGGIVTVAMYPIEQGMHYAIHTDTEITQEQIDRMSRNTAFLQALQRLPNELFSEEKKVKLEKKGLCSESSSPTMKM